ncbi:hypothetical protein BD770DRAFT_303658, partial [Pilaira anomala]
PTQVEYKDLNRETQWYFRHTISAVAYMSACLAITVLQVIKASIIAYKVRKWIHFAVVFETIFSFISIICSVLNPLTDLSCDFVR